MLPNNELTKGNQSLEKGLEAIKDGKIDEAIEYFYKAATAYDRAQAVKLIPALWEAIARMLEPDFVERYAEYTKALQSGAIEELYKKWYGFPLVYRVDAASEYEWEKRKEDPFHRQAWAYEWAAKHMERLGLYEPAYMLYYKGAEKAEQTDTGKKYPDWPAELYAKAVLNFIHAYGGLDIGRHTYRLKTGSPDEQVIQNSIIKMQRLFLKIGDPSRSYRLLAIHYRLFRSASIAAGNTALAMKFAKDERVALTAYHWYTNRYFRALVEWLSGKGFIYFVIILFVMVVFVFPFIYYYWKLIIPQSANNITYFHAVLYSVGRALGVEYQNMYPTNCGILVSLFESGLSWLGLGVFLWWLTKRLE